MHLLPTQEIGLDDGEAAVDLALPPGDVIALSFADSDLSALAAVLGMGAALPPPPACGGEGRGGGQRRSAPRWMWERGPLSAPPPQPSPPQAGGGSGVAATTTVDLGISAELDLRLVPLRQLKHPLSIDLLVEKTVSGSGFVLLRCLGGLDYWRYGIEQVSAACRAHGIPLAVLPGDDRADSRLAEYGTVEAAFAEELLAYFRAGGGAENMRRLLARIAAFRDARSDDLAPLPLPPLFALDAGGAPRPWQDALAACAADRPLVPVLVYRSAVSAGDTALPAALAAALAARGLAPLPLALTSLKDPEVAAALTALIAARRPALIVTTTAFAARDGGGFVLDGADCPVLQAVPVGSSREAWAGSMRGLSAPDLAMQVALPECDGRLGAIPVAFKQEQDTGGSPLRRFAPDAAGIAALADLAAGWVALATKPRAERRLALVMSDYPARGGRAGFAVGLDTPASVLAIRDLLEDAGYAIGAGTTPSPLPPACGGEGLGMGGRKARAPSLDVTPSGTAPHPSPPHRKQGEGERPAATDRANRDASDAAALMQALTDGSADFAVPLADYRGWLATIPAEPRAALEAAHGDPVEDPACSDGAFRFRTVAFGQLLVALQPARDGAADRKTRYHDAALPPGHAYLAFYLGLRSRARIDALIHLGTHGTTEWLPGKAVALSHACWPRLAIGALPVIYPYVVDDPGEAAPAKRRLAALTLGHLPPPLTGAEPAGEAALLRDLVEEYAQAQVLDPRRAAIVAGEILDRAQASGLGEACGIGPGQDMQAALAALDAHLCDLAELPFRDGLHIFGRSAADEASATAERENLLRALDGRFVPPGPAGSPHRGRPDVLPTGRNLTTMDPRAVPSRAAARLGAQAARAVIARYLQDEGEPPRRIVMDLWASPTLRSGGEDIAHALALMGAEPVWDSASTRVTGFSILPLAKLDHPRIDVTLRISGAFRDTFPTQIALLDAAARAVAGLDEPDEWNEPAAAHRRGEAAARIFGPAPGRFGAGLAARALDGDWSERSELGAAYIAASSHAYGGADGEGAADAGFARRVEHANAFVHVSDTPGRDILEATSAADAIGGFAAAAQGGSARLYSLDASQPETPRARSVKEDIARIVHGRLCQPRWISAQLAHGWRGAAELAEAVDTMFVYAAGGDLVADGLFDAVFQAYCGDPAVWNALNEANPAAAASIRDRLADALARGLWTSRLNSVAVLRGPGREAAE